MAALLSYQVEKFAYCHVLNYSKAKFLSRFYAVGKFVNETDPKFPEAISNLLHVDAKHLHTETYLYLGIIVTISL